MNPEAADFALTMGAKKVWMPTVDAARHAEVFGQGGYTLKTSGVGTAEPDKKSRHLLRKKPIRIVENGKLSDDAKDVVRICKIWDAMLGASHLYNEEIIALLRFAKEEKFAKVVITHANWTVLRNVDAGALKEMAELGRLDRVLRDGHAAAPQLPHGGEGARVAQRHRHRSDASSPATPAPRSTAPSPRSSGRISSS